MHKKHLKIIVLSIISVLLVAIGSAGLLAKSSPSTPTEPAVLEEFDELESFIANLANSELQKGNRNSLVQKLNNAEAAYRRGQACTAVNILGAYLNEAYALIRGKKLAVAEELRNRGWMLRHNLLVALPEGQKCSGFEDVGAAAELQIRKSSNQNFGALVSFGKPLLWTVQAAGQAWTQVEVPSLQYLVGEPGMPAIPRWYSLLAVPMGASVKINRANPVTGEELPIHLYPFQDQAADSLSFDLALPDLPFFDLEFANPPFVMNEKAYAMSGFYPLEPCVVAIIGQARDLVIAQLSCSAGQFNPATRTMRFFAGIDVEVVFEGGEGAFISDQSLSPFEMASKTTIAAVANKEIVRDYVLPKDLSDRICFGEELLILTHPDFRDAADDLAEWKRDKGISTTVREVGVGTVYDSGESIDDYIEWRYDHCLVRPSYILLLGDAEYIPPARQDVDTSEACSTCGDETTGSDYAYAIYPQFFFDIFPDFAVGRISVDTDVEAQRVVDKIVQYESDPPFVDRFSGDPFYTTAANAAQFQCCRMNANGTPRNGQAGTDQRAFIEVAEMVRDELIAGGYTVERIYTETVDNGGYCLDNASPCTWQQPYNGNTTPNRYYNGTLLPADLRSGSGFTWSGSTNDITDAFNDGRFLILHRDHGSSSGFSHPSFTNSNLGALANDDRLPVVYSVNCASGFFDVETDSGGSNESFMERLLLEDGGGMVGGLGDNRNSPTWANNALTRGFYDATWPQVVPAFSDNTSLHRLGDILNHGKMYLLTQIGVAQTAGEITLEAAFGELSIWHAFGDPTLEMWTRNPYRMLLTTEHTLEILKDRLLVKYATEGAVITALQETEEGVVPVGRAMVANGVANIPFFSEPQAGLPVMLSASYENAVSVPLRSAQQGPDLIVEELQLKNTNLVQGENLAGPLGIKVGNRGDADAPGTVYADGTVKDPAAGYMIDVVLSVDAAMPTGFANPADQTGEKFLEDALLVGGRVSRTIDVPAMNSIILPTDPPVSSDVGGIIPSQTPPGQYYLCARIDPGEAVQEADEGNNVTCMAITVSAPQR